MKEISITHLIMVSINVETGFDMWKMQNLTCIGKKEFKLKLPKKIVGNISFAANDQ